MSEQFNDCEKICRICRSNDLNEELLSPCECRGTLYHIHYKCLIDWINASKTDNCNICRTQYNCVEMTRTLPSVMSFLIAIFKLIKREITANEFVAILTLSLTVSAILIYLAYILFPSYDFLLKLCILVILLLGVMSALWMTILVPECRKWRTMNSVVYIKAKPKTKNQI